jgi:acyl-CoA thioesterase YciA
MKFYSRKLVKPQDLNSRGTLFGGKLLGWIDEEAAIFVMGQLGNKKSIVTKFMSEINFISSAQNGDIVEIGMEVVSIGRTSITVRCMVRNKISQAEIIRIEKIVFVHLDQFGKPTPHGIIQEA